MNYLSVFDHRTGKRKAFLQNAYNIGYSLTVNGVSTASFSLPTSDEKNAFCQPLDYVEMFDADKRVGLFRIVPTTFVRDKSTAEYTYQCEHVLATLMDDLLFGWHEIGNVGTSTEQVIHYLLERQTVPRWQLKTCDFMHQFLYGWENENLLSALLSVPNPFPAKYRWVTDTAAKPWTLSLKQWDETVKAQIRYRTNLIGIKKTVDPTNLTTRLYCLGYGEGENQLKLDGLPYLDADTMDQYGVISKIWVDRRYQNPQSLLDAGRAILQELKTPYISYEVDAVDLYGLSNLAPGDTVRVVDDEDGISFLAPVVSLSKSDVTGDNSTVSITIANKEKDIAATIADLSDRQRIADLYAQGSVNLDSHDFADNCDADNPATMRFYIPWEAIRINAVKLTYSVLPFRSYSKGITSKPQQSVTSSSGGGRETTTRSGGGKTSTTGLSSSTTKATGRADYGGSGDMTLENHFHYLTVPSHDHSFSVPRHSHDIDLPEHTHEIVIPEYTPQLEHGIFTGGTADAMTVEVDGVPLTESVLPDSDFDITNHLAVDEQGKIRRGTWHTIRLIPNALTRVEASLQSTIFINPRGGQNL